MSTWRALAIAALCWRRGSIWPFSHRQTVGCLTPTRSARRSWVNPRAFRTCRIFVPHVRSVSSTPPILHVTYARVKGFDQGFCKTTWPKVQPFVKSKQGVDDLCHSYLRNG